MTDNAVKRLFDIVAPRYSDRQGGYLRIVRTGFQQGRRRRKGVHRTAGRRKAARRKRQKRDEIKAKKRAELEKQLEEQQEGSRRNQGRRRGRVSSGTPTNFTDPQQISRGQLPIRDVPAFVPGESCRTTA